MLTCNLAQGSASQGPEAAHHAWGAQLEALRDQVLTWLAHCHLALGDGGSAASCLGALREAGAAVAGHPTVLALNVHTFLTLGHLQVSGLC